MVASFPSTRPASNLLSQYAFKADAGIHQDQSLPGAAQNNVSRRELRPVGAMSVRARHEDRFNVSFANGGAFKSYAGKRAPRARSAMWLFMGKFL
jgi:hypothetical protein